MTERAAMIPGYARITEGQFTVVARENHADDARALLAHGSLHDAAAKMTGARPLQGRGTAYAIELPVSGRRAVVRHNRHGGMFAWLTGDRFRAPTRAPHELVVAHQLRAAGVQTPDVLMIALSPRLASFQRADVVTQEIEHSRDLATYMQTGEPAPSRAAAWAAARALVRELNAAGARHADLNVKNILLAPVGDSLSAWVLDVDRVEFEAPGSASVARANLARLLRSARKWRDERGAEFDESELATLD